MQTTIHHMFIAFEKKIECGWHFRQCLFCFGNIQILNCCDTFHRGKFAQKKAENIQHQQDQFWDSGNGKSSFAVWHSYLKAYHSTITLAYINDISTSKCNLKTTLSILSWNFSSSKFRDEVVIDIKHCIHVQLYMKMIVMKQTISSFDCLVTSHSVV